MNEPRIFLCVTLLVAGSACGVASSVIGAEMQGMINERLGKGSQLEAPWWFAKQLKLFRVYRSFFPDSNLPALQASIGVFMLACVVALAVVIGII
jgi:hypothetical protein